MAACEGALILVDANSGVQAQTIAHFNHALLADLVMIPVLNKIDLKNADPDSVAQQMNKLFDTDPNDIHKVSAKLGTGVEELLNSIVDTIPAPTGDSNKPLKALVFDLWHEKFRGIIVLIRIIEGSLKTGDDIILSSNKKTHTIRKIGILYPNELTTDRLYSGQVGLIEANIHDNNDVNIGDIIYNSDSDINIIKEVPQIQKAVPMVFASIYPVEQSAHNDLAKAIEKLLLNDYGVDVKKESHPALGNGFRFVFNQYCIRFKNILRHCM